MVNNLDTGDLVEDVCLVMGMGLVVGLMNLRIVDFPLMAEMELGLGVDFVNIVVAEMVWVVGMISAMTGFMLSALHDSRFEDSPTHVVRCQMVGKFVCSRDEVSDIESRYEPPKKVSRDDPIMFRSMCADLEMRYHLIKENLSSAWFTNEEDYKKEREEMLKYDEVVRRKIMKELKGDPEDMDFEMSYARVNDKNYRDSNVDEDEDPETPPHYHIDEFHSDSSSEN
ncbi:hypothetical protein FNV43_RR01139 [Rhamnella rubrinervis]|uniref:Uncharacterized protein n=1 Tax=Rhamnella rubrinervis TaxID=2594499 RepID=A0A8K0MSN9_9ROSA|nr:hypothetical protein FNV43_RR01139 [Rhamnella rubrinervis]